MIYRMFMSNIMQQGNCNAPSMFQRTMNSIFHEYIRIFLHVYLDDLFVYSNLVQGHQKHLGMVFKKLREHKLYLREEKCELFAAKVNCLGHMIDEKGLHMDTDKMAKIHDWNNHPRGRKTCMEYGQHVMEAKLMKDDDYVVACKGRKEEANFW